MWLRITIKNTIPELLAKKKKKKKKKKKIERGLQLRFSFMEMSND